MKIETVTLKDMEVVQLENGNFERIFKDEKKYPCFLTNHAMKRGKDLGLISGSLIADLLKLQKLEGLDKDNIDPEIIAQLDETDFQKVIYLSFVGANKSKWTFDEFLEKYHYSFEDTTELYSKIILNHVAADPNKFVEGLNKSTSKKKPKHEKKHRNHRR